MFIIQIYRKDVDEYESVLANTTEQLIDLIRFISNRSDRLCIEHVVPFQYSEVKEFIECINFFDGGVDELHRN